MNSRDFIKPGMKKYRDGSEEMQAGGCRRQHGRIDIFAMA